MDHHKPKPHLPMSTCLKRTPQMWHSQPWPHWSHGITWYGSNMVLSAGAGSTAGGQRLPLVWRPARMHAVTNHTTQTAPALTKTISPSKGFRCGGPLNLSTGLRDSSDIRRPKWTSKVEIKFQIKKQDYFNHDLLCPWCLSRGHSNDLFNIIIFSTCSASPLPTLWCTQIIGDLIKMQSLVVGPEILKSWKGQSDARPQATFEWA